MYDIIIIGAGPAGLTAAIYARRANKKVLVIEKSTYGGQIVNAANIENYPGIQSINGFDFATNLYNQATALGAEVIFETVERVEEDKTIITNNNTYNAKSIIIATGSSNKKLNIVNEDKYIGKGVSYCATCDGNFYKGLDIAIVGGGNTAFEDAIYLSNIVNKVYLIHRREEFRADEKLVNELKQKQNVEFILNANVRELVGKNELEEIKIELKNDQIITIRVSALFIAIGQVPNNNLFSNILELDENGYIKTTDGVHTNINGIYIAGDCRVKDLRQLTTAIADGAIAATCAIKEN